MHKELIKSISELSGLKSFIASRPVMFSFSELSTKYLMIGLKKTIRLIFFMRYRFFSEHLVRRAIMIITTMTITSKIKVIVARTNVGPKLVNGLEEPSLSSPTFSSVEESSSVSIPMKSMAYPAKSISSMNSPNAILLS